MRLSAWILTVILLLPWWPVAAGEVVGAAGWVDRIDFIGHTAFTTEELRDGLSADLDFLAAAQPHAPRNEFLATLASRVREGCRHNGFPDAEAVAEMSEDGRRAVVRITEGPRYRCGHVLVRGGRTISRDEIERAFTEPWAGPTLIPVAKLTADGLRTRWENGLGKEGLPDPPLWIPGTPLTGSDFDLTQLHERAKEALALQGYHRPKFRTHLHRAPQAQHATLVIEIDEQGPPFVFGSLSIEGETSDSAKLVMQFLDLKPGQPISTRCSHIAAHRLWHSGRYLVVLTAANALGLSPDPPLPLPRSRKISEGESKKNNDSPAATPDQSANSPPYEISESGDIAESGDTSPFNNPKTRSTRPIPGEPDPDRPVSVRIDVVLHDAGHLCPLSESPDPADQAMLRLCEWLRRGPGDAEYDLVVNGKVQSWGMVNHDLISFAKGSFGIAIPSHDFYWRFRGVFSRGRMSFIRLRHAFKQDEPDFDQAVLIRPDRIDWLLPLRKSCLSLPWDARRGYVSNLRLSADPFKPSGRMPASHLLHEFDGGQLGRPSAPAEPGLHPEFEVDPFLALLYLRSEGVTHSLTDGVLHVAGPRLRFEVDAESGRLLRARVKMWNDAATIDVWSERGALAKTVGEFDEQAGPLTEQFDPSDPWGSICECLRREFAPLGGLDATPVWPAATAAVKLLRRLDPRQLVEIFELTDAVPRRFSIPAPEEPLPVWNYSVQRGGDAASLLLRHCSKSDELRAIAVDFIHQRVRPGQSLPHEVPIIARGDSTGPVTRLVVISLLPERLSTLRSYAASRARETLTRDHILREFQLLLSGGVPISAECEHLLEALGELTEEECRALAKQFLPGNLAQAVVDATSPLRRDRVRPVRELLPEVFDRFWSGGLEKVIAGRLAEWAKHELGAHAPESTDDPDTAFPVVPSSFNQTAQSEDPSFPEDLPESPAADLDATESQPERELMLDEGACGFDRSAA